MHAATQDEIDKVERLLDAELGTNYAIEVLEEQVDVLKKTIDDLKSVHAVMKQEVANAKAESNNALREYLEECVGTLH